MIFKKVKVKAMQMSLLKILLDETAESEMAIHMGMARLRKLSEKIKEFVELEYPESERLHWVIKPLSSEIWFRSKLGHEKDR